MSLRCTSPCHKVSQPCPWQQPAAQKAKKGKPKHAFPGQKHPKSITHHNTTISSLLLTSPLRLVTHYLCSFCSSLSTPLPLLCVHLLTDLIFLHWPTTSVPHWSTSYKCSMQWMYLCLWHTGWLFSLIFSSSLHLISPSSHQQEGPPTWAWFCSRCLLLVEDSFQHPSNHLNDTPFHDPPWRDLARMLKFNLIPH